LEELQWLLAHSLSGHQTLIFQAHHLDLLTFDKFHSVLRVIASVLSIHHLHSVKCGVDWILQVFLCKYKEVF
jgi:predicted nuclease of restriction endonuclease-like RecB superfamily